MFENLKNSPKKYPKTRTLRVTFAQIEFLVTKNSFVYFKFVQFECRILRWIAVLATADKQQRFDQREKSRAQSYL